MNDASDMPNLKFVSSEGNPLNLEPSPGMAGRIDNAVKYMEVRDRKNRPIRCDQRTRAKRLMAWRDALLTYRRVLRRWVAERFRTIVKNEGITFHAGELENYIDERGDGVDLPQEHGEMLRTHPG